MKALLVWLLRGYQLLLSPMLGQNCRFYPSCSNYAIEALRTHGAARGSLLAARRVCRCHPWNAGGVDPVPPRHEQSSTAACGCNHS
jgi:putative membrane protein insertion efficiency factor